MNEAHYVPGMTGCSDGGCLFNYKAPGTMVTNGGCSCMRELTRSDVGFRAYRTILWLRQNQPTPQADEIAERIAAVRTPVYKEPQRTMQNKVSMIKDVYRTVDCGLREAKEAVDEVYASCTDYDQVIQKAVAYIERIHKPQGYCRMGDNCVCGGDVPRVREGCFEWKNL